MADEADLLPPVVRKNPARPAMVQRNRSGLLHGN